MAAAITLAAPRERRETPGRVAVNSVAKYTFGDRIARRRLHLVAATQLARCARLVEIAMAIRLSGFADGVAATFATDEVREFLERAAPSDGGSAVEQHARRRRSSTGISVYIYTIPRPKTSAQVFHFGHRRIGE